MNNRSGKIDLSLIIGILLSIGIIIGLLQISGIINIKALFGETGTFIKINYEKEVEKMCNKIDGEGFYNHELYEKISNETTETQKNILEQIDTIIKKDDDSIVDKLANEYWNNYKDADYCFQNQCILASKDGDKTIYIYSCNEKEHKKENIDDVFSEAIANGILENACNKINNNGFYENEEEQVKCGNFHCNAFFKGKDYRKDCKEKNS